MTRGTGSGKTPKRVIELLQKEVSGSSQSAVSRVLGIGIPTIHRYLKGIGEPSHDVMQKLSVHFELPVEWLRGDVFEDEWGEPYGDDLDSDQVEALKDEFWRRRTKKSANAPVIQDVVKCLLKLPQDARAAAILMFRKMCRDIESMPNGELIRVGEELKAQYQAYCEACQQQEAEKG